MQKTTFARVVVVSSFQKVEPRHLDKVPEASKQEMFCSFGEDGYVRRPASRPPTNAIDRKVAGPTLRISLLNP